MHTGGVSEGVAALAAAGVRIGLDVSVAIPRLPSKEPAGFGGALETIAEYTFAEPTRVLAGALPGAGEPVRLFLVEAPSLSSRADPYGEDSRDLESAARAALFCRAIVELVLAEAAAGRPFDVVHVHEWPCAPIPYLLRERGGAAGTRTVLGIHNLMHQGVFPLAALASLGLGPEHATMERLEFHGFVSFLKAGVLAADAIVTVSPTYATEILAPEQGELLEGVLATRRDRLFGVANGIDVTTWDPARDPHLPARFSADDLAGKAACRAAVAAELGLEAGRPLVASLGRVIEQKGSDVLADALGAIVDAGAVVAVAGTGDPALVARLRAAVAARPRAAAYVGFAPDPLAHRLIAGADAVVMPSRYEPCGIVQLYAQRYAAVPVVRRTGGLTDTVLDAEADPEGTGFFFDAVDAGALAGATARALARLAGPDGDALRRRCARRAVGWDLPAARYLQIYRRLG